MTGFRWIRVLVLAAAALATVTSASAHPHVFVNAKAEVVFDKDGRVTAVRHVWQFDEAFSAFATQGLDKNGDGKLAEAELAPLAKINMESLKDYDFFTYLNIGKGRVSFAQPTGYRLQFHNGSLTLFYTLPLKIPTALTGKTAT